MHKHSFAAIALLIATQAYAAPVAQAVKTLKDPQAFSSDAAKKALTLIENVAHECLHGNCAALGQLFEAQRGTTDPAARQAYQQAINVLTKPGGVSQEGAQELLQELKTRLTAHGSATTKTKAMEKALKTGTVKLPPKKQLLAKQKAAKKAQRQSLKK
jgi:hypothetical protein